MQDREYLLAALTQAQQGQGRCSPNPAVGAVIVKDGEILATGYHQGPGTDHAEAMAIKQCADAKGSTIYVTLEPCCHHGRTPPCTTAIIEAGIARVVYAVQDPIRHIDDKGGAVLLAANVICEQVPVEEITQFYRAFLHWVATGKPWLTAKIAMSPNGKIAAADGSPVAITGAALQQLTHQSRLQADALLTSVTTLICDDPQFTVRLSGQTIKKPLIVLDSDCRLPLTANVFETAKQIILFHKKTANSQRLAALQQQGVNCIAVDYEKGLDLESVLQHCGKLGFHAIWMESGGVLLNAMVNAGLTNEVVVYTGSKALPADFKDAFVDASAFFDALILKKESHIQGEVVRVMLIRGDQ